MKRVTFVLISCTILMALSACDKAVSPTPFTQTVGALTATLNVIPYPPVPMGDTTLELTLRDAEGQPVSGADVRFDLTMPGMEMPPNQPEATDAGEGLYRAQAIFTMAGEWQIAVEVSYQGTTEEFVFNLRTK